MFNTFLLRCCITWRSISFFFFLFLLLGSVCREVYCGFSFFCRIEALLQFLWLGGSYESLVLQWSEMEGNFRGQLEMIQGANMRSCIDVYKSQIIPYKVWAYPEGGPDFETHFQLNSFETNDSFKLTTNGTKP